MSLLEIEGLSVSFRRYRSPVRQVGVKCVSDISLDVYPGEVLALFGASGAGKSLLAHAVMGLLPQNAIVGGVMRFEGRLLDRKEQARMAGSRIALIPQSVSHLDPLATVGQQLRWAARRARRPMASAGDMQRTLARFDLEPGVSRAFPHMLSGGMARRIMLAMTTVCQADLIIADEPSNGLDAENTAIVFRWLKSFAEAGKSVIVISHDLAATLQIADRVIILRDGYVAAHEHADVFSGDGTRLLAPYARSVWKALPQNGFAEVEA